MFNLKVIIIGCDEDVMPHVFRELTNHAAEISAKYPDMATALRQIELGASDTCLLIVQIDSVDELSELKRLSGTFVGWPIMVLTDNYQDSNLVLKVVRMGASQVVALPLQSEDFSEAMNCISMQSHASNTQSKTIAVSGTSGGCGCTTIAMNLAYEVGFLREIHCILLELSLRMGSLVDHLDIQPRYTTADLLEEAERLDSYLIQQALTNIATNFSILPGPYETVHSYLPQVEEVIKLINLTKPLTPILFMDIPCLYDDLYFRTLSAADKVVLVVDQKVSSIRGANMICNTLAKQRPYIIINRYDNKAEGFSAEKLKKILQPQALWIVSQDNSVVTAVNNGRPLRLESTRSRALADIDNIIEELIPESNTSQPRKSSLLGRLTQALSFSHKE